MPSRANPMRAMEFIYCSRRRVARMRTLPVKPGAGRSFIG
jgi:hypothetical protein